MPETNGDYDRRSCGSSTHEAPVMTDATQPDSGALEDSATSDNGAQANTAQPTIIATGGSQAIGGGATAGPVLPTPYNAAGMWLLDSTGGWKSWDESEEKVKQVLHEALNSTNLIALLGSGASIATNTDEGSQKAPSMSDLWSSARDKVKPAKFDKVASEMLSESNDKNIETLLSLCKMKIALIKAKEVNEDEPSSEFKRVSSFVENSEGAILECVDFVSDKTNLDYHIKFLNRLTRRSSEKPRFKIFTTNYDVCIEQAAAKINLVIVDGFSHSVVQRYNRDHFHYDIVRRSQDGANANYIDGVLHLYKMHGSMDWRRRVSDNVVIRSKSSDKGYEPVLIYPRSTKYQEAYLPPYLDMFAAWQESLREPDTTLIISGFGFADDHVSAPIWSALESNLSFRLVLCDPLLAIDNTVPNEGQGNSYRKEKTTRGDLKPYQSKIIELVKAKDSRITVLNGGFADLAEAIPEIKGETERSQIQRRMADVTERSNV